MKKSPNLLRKNCNNLNNANLDEIITDENTIIDIPFLEWRFDRIAKPLKKL
jgi:hypothetical protein